MFPAFINNTDTGKTLVYYYREKKLISVNVVLQRAIVRPVQKKNESHLEILNFVWK